ncbi:MAG: AAA family ATPase, partial [Sinobacterium sp.]|nr:AAA family ATPase [Sinobacterium sp.]
NPSFYSLDYINSSVDVAAVVSGIKLHGSARVCFYGPPGTGKTALGAHIAKSLGKELLLKKASDLLGMYVGETEKNIASAFEEAGRSGCVLMFDEVDSFLQDRRNAKQSWQVSQVNEMLTQMESFDGVFIASTNLMEHLDQAALRRFDMKLKLGYLLPGQLKLIFNAVCDELKLEPASQTTLKQLAQLVQIAPGDFAAIIRQGKFNPIINAEGLYERLCEEQAIKEPTAKSIGFIH